MKSTGLLNAFKEAFSKIPHWEEKLLNPPSKEEEINLLKEKIKEWGLPELPALFYDFYRWHNGSKREDYSYQVIDGGDVILPIASIISDKEMWDDLEEKNTFKAYEAGTWWNKAWVPFLYRQDWWLGAIDTEGCFGGKAGQILCFDFKSAEGKDIEYASFEKWLETMLAYLENGLLEYETDQEGDLIELSFELEEKKESIYKEINGDFNFHVEIWKFLRKEKPENPFWKDLEIVIANDDINGLNELLDAGKIALNEQNTFIKERFTPLLLAINQQAYTCTEFLILKGANLNIHDCYGMDAFGSIINEYRGENTSKIIKMIDLLLERNYQPEKVYDDNPLLTRLIIQAVSYEDESMLDYCLDKGVPINVIPYSYSPDNLLQQALNYDRFHIARALIERGIDKNYRNKKGETALDILERRKLSNKNREDFVEIQKLLLFE